jgi:excisionase family DNA binding protein
MSEKLLTTDQVARYLNIDKFTVYRLVTQRKIPAFKVGNQWRFKKNMIDAWLLKNSNRKENESY